MSLPMLEAAADTARWRKSKREELIAARLAVPVDERARVAGEVAEELDRLIAPGPGRIISLYWPFRGELDLRDWMRGAHERGARIALPVVVEKAQPLIFREWSPGCRMERGVWNIPIPAKDNRILPNVVISPLVGYDPSCFRLGYGGGFYDRTLASMTEHPTGHRRRAAPWGLVHDLSAALRHPDGRDRDWQGQGSGAQGGLGRRGWAQRCDTVLVASRLVDLCNGIGDKHEMNHGFANSRRININGARLAYVEQGSGDPVVLVHGGVSDLRTWDSQVSALAQHFRVLALQPPLCPAECRNPGRRG